MNRILSEFEQLLRKCSELPDGNYRAYAELEDELFGAMMATRKQSLFCYRNPVRAMKKAKKLAEIDDRQTTGMADGIVYGITEEN